MLDLHLFIVPPWLNIVLFTVTPAIAFWRGDWRTRLIGSIALVQYLVSSYLCRALGCWAVFPLDAWRSLVSDLLMLAACLLVARRAQGYWAIWVSSFAVLAVVTDVMFLTGAGVSPWAYLSANNIWAYALLATVLWATIREDRRPVDAAA